MNVLTISCFFLLFILFSFAAVILPLFAVVCCLCCICSGVPLSARFNGTGSSHKSVSGSNGVFWYSFNEGPVHIIMMSSEHDWRKTSRQYQWLLADLASVNRLQTP